MNCKSCIYCNRCKHPNENRPSCLMVTRYEKAQALAKIPKRYKNSRPENIPIEKDNPEAYRVVMKYCNDVVKFATEDCYSLYMYSVPSKDNPLGTGTGKTTCACAILNKFIEDYVWKTAMLRGSMLTLPALFVKCSDFQNIYNAQFRDKVGASEEYYAYKDNMKVCNLLVLDDIAVRSCTEAFMNELYEVINHRVSEQLATIYTSNVSLEQLGSILDERIASRIREDCIIRKFVGKDHRDF